jgi:hypothetical protein
MLSPSSVIVSVQLWPYLLDADCRLTSLGGLVVAVVEDASAGVEEKGDGAVVLVLMSPTPSPLSSAVCLVGTFNAVAYVGMMRKSAGTRLKHSVRARKCAYKLLSASGCSNSLQWWKYMCAKMHPRRHAREVKWRCEAGGGIWSLQKGGGGENETYQ